MKSKAEISEYLDPLTSRVKAGRFITYDIESKHDDTQNAGFTRPFLLGMFDPSTNRYREFRDEPHLAPRDWFRRHLDPGGCIDKFMTAFLTKTYAGTIAYAHNAGSFDALFLLTWLAEHRDEFAFEVVPVASSIQVIRVWRLPDNPDEPVREKWDFLDSMKLLPMGLEKACKAMGVPGKMSHDLNMHESDSRWSEYLEQDCRALSAVMSRLYNLVENRLGGEVGMTTPSTSVRLFRRRYLGRNGVQEKVPRYRHFPGCTKPESCDACLHAWIRLGYYGGRTEIHHFAGELLRYFDFNSSYAASMNEDMPIGDLIVEDHLDMRRHTSQGGRYAGFAEVTVEISPECPIPPLPHRNKETGKLIFPTGRFHGVWSVDELALLDDPLVGGTIVHVKRVVWFGLRPMFQGMVKELYELRDKDRADFDEGLSLLAKLLLNGGYGKFAMRSERSTVVFAYKRAEHPSGHDEVSTSQCFLCREALPVDANDRPTAAVCTECEGSKPASPEAEGAVWYKAQKTDAAYIIPQIAAQITATARVRLWRSMRDVVSSFAGEHQTAGQLTFGSVVLIHDAPHVIAFTEKKGKYVHWIVRSANAEGRTELSRVRMLASSVVRVGGRIYYLDTDSLITNVDLPTSNALGALKDEYPGDTLSYVGLQAKAYMIARTRDLERAERVRALIDMAKSGKNADPSTLDGEVLNPGKVTLKGFPGNMRTPAYFDRVRNKGTTLEWQRLEKVRTLARASFGRSPRMSRVTKSIQSDYDKRQIWGQNETRAHVLDEPIGGLVEMPRAAFEDDAELPF